MPNRIERRSECLAWLLDEKDPGPRYLALRDLLHLPPDDPELIRARAAAHVSGPIAEILAHMDPAGYWERPGPGYNPKYRSTVWSLILLAQLGARAAEDPRVSTACAYLLEHNLSGGGQFSTSSAPSGTVDCLQGNLCWALLEMGYTDPRMETAYDWLARSVTGEGIAPLEDKRAPSRYYAYKCGPGFACGVNGSLPCGWGAAKVMLALAKWPADHRTPAMQRAIGQGTEFLLGVDPATAAYPVASGGKPNRAWWKFGFPVFYITDVLQVVEALVALGYRDDPRLAHSWQVIGDKQDAEGRWSLEYDYTGKTWVNLGTANQLNKWVTIRALRALGA